MVGRIRVTPLGSSAALAETYVYRVLDNQDPQITLRWWPTPPAGAHEVPWGIGSTGRISRPGVYFSRLDADGQRLTRRFVLLAPLN